MEHFWILVYLDAQDKVGRDKFDNEEDARAAWYIADHPLFLDEVYRKNYV
ncbi:hypothetical protein SEA_LEWANDO_41 [Arthrobacter phage Lewando]|nr:hypothetical protein SEA_LEWANDO_41 [Arthrobacter phage Lewando]